MMRFSRSLSTTSSVVLYSSWVLSPQGDRPVSSPPHSGFASKAEIALGPVLPVGRTHRSPGDEAHDGVPGTGLQHLENFTRLRLALLLGAGGECAGYPPGCGR